MLSVKPSLNIQLSREDNEHGLGSSTGIYSSVLEVGHPKSRSPWVFSSGGSEGESVA